MRTSRAGWNGCVALEQKHACSLPIHVPRGRSPSGFRPPIPKTNSGMFPTSSAPPPLLSASRMCWFVRSGAVVAVMDAYIMHQACIFSWPEPPGAAQATILPSVFTYVRFPDHSEKQPTYFCCYFAETHLLVRPRWQRRDLTAAAG